MPTGVYIGFKAASGRFEELKIKLRKKPGELSSNETKFRILSHGCTAASQERASTAHFRHFLASELLSLSHHFSCVFLTWSDNRT
jgi:hypothetical protein